MREKIRVENRDELTLGNLQSGVQCAGLVAGAIDAMDVDDVEARLGQVRHEVTHEGAGLVGRIVQNLYFELLARVFDARDVVEEAAGNGGLIIEGELNRHVRDVGLGSVELPGVRPHRAELLAQPNHRENEM